MKPIIIRRPFTIVINTDDSTLAYVGWGSPPVDMLPRHHQILGGSGAVLLYIALAGHTYDIHPGDVDTNLAAFARGAILSKFDKRFHHAKKIVQVAGNQINPWLGKIYLDGQDRPMPDDPIHSTKIQISQMPDLAAAAVAV